MMRRPPRRWLRRLLVITTWVALSASSRAVTQRFVVTEFGARGDGTTLNTIAIQRAIHTAATSGGGTVEIPAGVFRTGSIMMEQGVALYLAEAAVLLGSKDIEDYPKRMTRIEGHFEPWRMALINAQELHDVHLYGKGRIDGSGPVFWEAFWQGRRENSRCTNLEVERPRLLFMDRCRTVRIEDLALQDSGFWNVHLYRCQDVILSGLRITLPSTTATLHGPSTDGIDIDSSQNVTVRHCTISVNDDNIALKGSKGPFADRDQESPPVENILIEDCEFGDGNGLITCGSEATIVRNVTARNCTITGRATLLTLKLRPDTPQRYENIVIDGIQLSGQGRILNVAPWTQFFDLKGEPPPHSTIQGVTLRNVSGTARTLGSLRGHANSSIRDITLENIQVTVTDDKLALGPVENFSLTNVKVNGRDYALERAHGTAAP
ncbi:MAG: glycosyl hydrolase family 28 protein [Opitutus sp.]